MSYTPHEWQDEEIITAQKLNNMEQGITNINKIANITFINNNWDGSHNIFQQAYHGYIDNTDHISGTLDKIWGDGCATIGTGIYPFLFPLANEVSLILWDIPDSATVSGAGEIITDIALPNSSAFRTTLIVYGDCVVTY